MQQVKNYLVLKTVRYTLYKYKYDIVRVYINIIFSNFANLNTIRSQQYCFCVG